MKPGQLASSLNAAMAARKGLGNLVPEDHVTGAEASSVGDKMVSVDLIDPSPYQPRLTIDDERIDALAENIREVGGILQPIVVRPKGDERFELVAGERRWLAFKACGYTQIPANIRHLSDEEAYKMCASENLQREGLASYEIAKMLSGLKTNGVCKSNTDLAKLTGIHRVSVINYLKFLELPHDVLVELEASPNLIGSNYVAGFLALVSDGHEDKVVEAVLRIRDGRLLASKAEEWIRHSVTPSTTRHERTEFMDQNGNRHFTLTRGGKRLSITVANDHEMDELHTVLEAAMSSYLKSKAGV